MVSSLLACLLAFQAPVTVNLRDFGGAPDGETDMAEALGKAYAALPDEGGIIQIPKGDKPYVLRAEKPTNRSPKLGLRVRKPNVWIVGVGGRPTIHMTGVTLDEMNAQEDFERSGRDWFTVFSFVLTKGGGVRNISFRGDWDGLGRYRYGAPRVKGVGIIGSDDVTVEDVDGFGLLGNVVNAVAANPRMEERFKWAERAMVRRSRAELCAENGFNYMGGVRDSQMEDIVSLRNGSTGVESGGENNVLRRVTAYGNGICGVSISQKGTQLHESRIFGNGNLDRKDAGMGVIVNGQGLKVTNTEIIGNAHFGVYVYPKSRDIELSGLIVRGNSAGGAATSLSEVCISPDVEGVVIKGSRVEALGRQQTLDAFASKSGADSSLWRLDLNEALGLGEEYPEGSHLFLSDGVREATATLESVDAGRRRVVLRVTSGSVSPGPLQVVIGSRSRMMVQEMGSSRATLQDTQLKPRAGG